MGEDSPFIQIADGPHRGRRIFDPDVTIFEEDVVRIVTPGGVQHYRISYDSTAKAITNSVAFTRPIQKIINEEDLTWA